MESRERDSFRRAFRRGLAQSVKPPVESKPPLRFGLLRAIDEWAQRRQQALYEATRAEEPPQR